MTPALNPSRYPGRRYAYDQDNEQPFGDDTGLDSLASVPSATPLPPSARFSTPPAPMPPPNGVVQPMNAPPPYTSPGPPPSPAMDFNGPKIPPPPKEAPQQSGTLDRSIGILGETRKPTPPDSDAPAEDARGVGEKIAALDKPEAPKSNWAQRLATILLTGRLGQEGAEAVVHPKYTEQRRTYERQVGDITSQAKAEEAEAGTAASVEQKEATAQWRKAQAADDATKVANAKATKDAATLEKQQQDALRIGGMGGKLVDASVPVPNGYVAVPNLSDNSKQWIVPPVKTHFPVNAQFKKMAEDAGIGGLEEGQLVDFNTWAKVADINAKKNLQENKPDRRLTTSDLAIRSAGGDPNDPDSVTPEIAGRAVDRLKPPREPRQPSAAETTRQQKQSVIRGAQQALRDLQGVDPNDLNRYDYAEKNVRDLNNYAGNSDVDGNREGIAQQLQVWKAKALPQAKGKTGAWRGAAATAQPKPGAAQQAPKGPPPQASKVATRAHVQAYANQKNIPYAQAEQEFKQSNYAIQ